MEGGGVGASRTGRKTCMRAITSAVALSLVALTSLNGALNPIVDADLLEGSAAANWNSTGCLLGTDIANGQGHAARAEAIGSGGPNPTVDAPGDSKSASHMVMVPQQDKDGNILAGG